MSTEDEPRRVLTGETEDEYRDRIDSGIPNPEVSSDSNDSNDNESDD